MVAGETGTIIISENGNSWQQLPVMSGVILYLIAAYWIRSIPDSTAIPISLHNWGNLLIVPD